jgi:predicted DCC family thiol-disulfide oxidoreductase YuxK
VVSMLLRSDRDGVLRFATLQGEMGQAWLKAHGLPADDFDSLVLVRDWESADSAYLMRTDGLAVALRAAGGPVVLAALLRILPRALRDAGYRVVARLRRRLFGPWKVKPLGRPEWPGRFIDGSRT